MINKTIISLLLITAAVAILPSDAAAQSEPYARYATPGECAMALNRLEGRYWRARRPDTVYFGPYGQAPQRSSVAEVKKCVSKFNIDKVAERDLIALGYAFVRAEEIDKAEEAFRRLLVLQANKPIATRINALAQIVDIYSKARPTQIRKAREYILKLDALGTAAAPERVIAHLKLYEAARMADSVSLVEEEAKAAVKASNAIAIDSIKKQRAFASVRARLALTYWYNRRGDGPNAVAALEQARIDLTPLRTVLQGSFDGTIAQYKLLGKPAPRIQATRWSNGISSKTNPALSKASTVTFVSHGCHPVSCYPGYSVARRLKAGGDGVLSDLIFVNRTEGYYRMDVVEPAKEFDLSLKYFLEYLKLPVTLATWQTDFGVKPDGRLDVLSNPNEEAYRPFLVPHLQTYVIDKNGNIRFITNMLPEYEVELDNVLKEVSQ